MTFSSFSTFTTVLSLILNHALVFGFLVNAV